MPPKGVPAKGGGGKEKKADIAKKQKLVEDKTFGLKNKNKSTKVQKYVQSLTQAAQPQRKRTEPEDHKTAQRKKKEEEAAREKELNELFKVAISQPKVPVGVDPKSILCEFFRRGQCTKGFKCKFSHDVNVERKGEKIDLYSDQRDVQAGESMEDWDQEKLENVVETKGQEYANQNKGTTIVCKYFLEAVEKKQYGWFWVCPNNGKDCQYRHALPPGYVLKSQMKALLEEEGEKLPVEDEIEEQRHKLAESTPLTTELFAEWKRKKKEKRDADDAERQAERAKTDRMSGRELFLSNAALFVDDAEACDEYEREDQDEDQGAATELSSSTTQASSERGSNGNNASEKLEITDEDAALLAEDDDDLSPEELAELEKGIASTALQDT